MESYRLVQLANGVHSVHSLEFAETFHPVVGPVAEAEALYVRQLNLIERRRETAGEFVIWDIGLGAAANALTVLRAVRDLPGQVRMISFDCTIEPLQFALKHAGALGYLSGYERMLCELATNHAVILAEGKGEWSLHLSDFPSLISRPEAEELPKPHVILFDAFSLARNAAMWTQPLFARLYQLLNLERPCALATYSRSTMLRVSLLLAGFYVGVGHATGEKEETTIAANNLALISSPLGKGWLQRARNSTSAEPLWEAHYRQARLTSSSVERLAEHPQFCHCDPTSVGRGGLSAE